MLDLQHWAGRLRYAEVTRSRLEDHQISPSRRLRGTHPPAVPRALMDPATRSLSYSSAVIHERYSEHFGVEVEAVRGSSRPRLGAAEAVLPDVTPSVARIAALRPLPMQSERWSFKWSLAEKSSTSSATGGARRELHG